LEQGKLSGGRIDENGERTPSNTAHKKSYDFK
jgi:hypothetical protein